jgi:hypothetical protein
MADCKTCEICSTIFTRKQQKNFFGNDKNRITYKGRRQDHLRNESSGCPLCSEILSLLREKRQDDIARWNLQGVVNKLFNGHRDGITINFEPMSNIFSLSCLQVTGPDIVADRFFEVTTPHSTCIYFDNLVSRDTDT